MDKVEGQTYIEVLKWASSFLKAQNEEAYLAEYLLLERLGWNKTQLLMSFKKDMPVDVKKQFELDLHDVLMGKPAQYVIGSTEFYGQRFTVTQDTLIPRPETEELVELCLTDNGDSSQTVVDIGTGSGIIGITLKKHRPKWVVTASDISPAALEVAQSNAQQQNVKLNFLLSDVLDDYVGAPIDILVSNPPYIAETEKDVMDESVKRYEPKLALYAADNGLALYKKIALQAKTHLASSGHIYLEIGYRQGETVKTIFQEAFPNKEVTILKDLNQQERMIRVR